MAPNRTDPMIADYYRRTHSLRSSAGPVPTSFGRLADAMASLPNAIALSPWVRTLRLQTNAGCFLNTSSALAYLRGLVRRRYVRGSWFC